MQILLAILGHFGLDVVKEFIAHHASAAAKLEQMHRKRHLLMGELLVLEVGAVVAVVNKDGIVRKVVANLICAEL